ncbi:MAG TPA: hypothetical protein VL832_07770 [Puia sp.]|nr:hypothetical protein [Puia sp.]
MLSEKRKTVFISGSAYEYGIFGETGKTFIRDLSRALVKNGFRIVSGFGLGVGSHILDGALEEIYLGQNEKITDHLQVFPFPSAGHPERITTSYRKDMISRAGVVIFVFGNKLEDIEVREADGMWKEFEIARSNKAILIPVGASGYASEKLWKKVVERFDDYFETREKFERYLQLGNPFLQPEQLIHLIIEIAK